MGGLFGTISKEDCVTDLFYGTDYHSHLGTVRGGMAVRNGKGFTRLIKDITNAQFRSKFEENLPQLHGTSGLGVISDYEDQPLLIAAHHAHYAIVTVGRIDNLDELAAETLKQPNTHFSEMKGNEVFKVAVRTLGRIVDETLGANDLQKSDLDWLIPHQANLRILSAAADRLNIPAERVVSNLSEYGNTSAASIPLALDEAVRDGSIKSGDYVCMPVFGGGLTWGSALIHF